MLMDTTHEHLSFSEFLARLKRVTRLFGQVVQDGTSGGRTRLVIVVAMSFVGASAQAGTIAALNFFVKGIESDVPRVIPYLGFPIQNDVRTLIALTAVVLGLQVVNALAIFYVGVTSRAIARAFHVQSAAKTVRAFSTIPYLRPGLANARMDLLSAITKYPRILGMAIEQLVGALQAVCYVAGFLVVLFTISVEVSLLTLPVFLLVLPFLYRLSTQTQKAAKTFFGEARQQATIFTMEQFQASDQTNVHPALYAASQEQQYRESAAVRRLLDNYDHLRLSQRRSDLITSLFRGFLLCLILVVLGSFSVRGSYSWGELLVYVLALWQLANHVQKVTSSLVSLNRFHPRIVSYYAVQAVLTGKATDPPAASLEEPLVITSQGCLEGDSGRLEMRRGDRIFFLAEASLSRLEFARVLTPLLAACPDQKRVLRSASFCSGADASPNMGLSAMVLGSESPSADQIAMLEARITKLELAQELAALPEGSASLLSEETWSTMSQELRVALRILALAESPSDLLFLDWGLLGSLETEFAKRLLAMLDDRIVLFVSEDGSIECEWATGFIVSESEEIVGVGDERWWGEILQYRRQRLPSRGAAGAAGDREDEDEDM
jgi:ABC-type multidrug transport system fused ATPase/permease subunit